MDLIPKRITSQVTWESQDQKDAFILYLKNMGIDSVTEYCRRIADLNIEVVLRKRNDTEGY